MSGIFIRSLPADLQGRPAFTKTYLLWICSEPSRARCRGRTEGQPQASQGPALDRRASCHDAKLFYRIELVSALLL